MSTTVKQPMTLEEVNAEVERLSQRPPEPMTVTVESQPLFGLILKAIGSSDKWSPKDVATISQVMAALREVSPSINELRWFYVEEDHWKPDLDLI